MTTALVVSKGPKALTYMREAVVNPASLSVLAFGTCVGVGYAGLTGGLLAAGGVAGTIALACLTKPIRRVIDVIRSSRAKSEKERSRQERIKAAGPSRVEDLKALQKYADIVAENDPSVDVDGLLEAFITLSVQHVRCLDALSMTGSSEGQFYASTLKRSAERAELERQAERFRDDLTKKINGIEQEMSAISALLRLSAARAQVPDQDDDSVLRVTEFMEAHKDLMSLTEKP